MILKLKRTPGIYLVGFMGSGKSTVGKQLARELGWAFHDIDEEIEAAEGRTIAAIFESEGEEAFRKIEHRILLKRVRIVEKGRPTVVALGGGAFVQEDNYELLENNGVTIWLDPPFTVIRRRVEAGMHRPLARDPQQLEQLYQDRRDAYARADYHVRESDSPSAVAAILRLPIF